MILTRESEVRIRSHCAQVAPHIIAIAIGQPDIVSRIAILAVVVNSVDPQFNRRMASCFHAQSPVASQYRNSVEAWREV